MFPIFTYDNYIVQYGKNNLVLIWTKIIALDPQQHILGYWFKDRTYLE